MFTYWKWTLFLFIYWSLEDIYLAKVIEKIIDVKRRVLKGFGHKVSRLVGSVSLQNSLEFIMMSLLALMVLRKVIFARRYKLCSYLLYLSSFRIWFENRAIIKLSWQCRIGSLFWSLQAHSVWILDTHFCLLSRWIVTFEDILVLKQCFYFVLIYKPFQNFQQSM